MSGEKIAIRWPYVVTYAVLNLSNAWMWSTYAGVSPTSALYYNINESAITWFSLIFMALYVPVTIASSYVLDEHGLRAGLLLGAALNGAGAVIRYLSCFISGTAGRFTVAFTGQVLCAIAQPFILNAPPKIANQYFGPSERTLADAVMNLANPIGAALALVVTPGIVNKNPDNLPTAILIAMIVSLVPIPLAPFVFRKNNWQPSRRESSAMPVVEETGKGANASVSGTDVVTAGTTAHQGSGSMNLVAPAIVPFRVACRNLARNKNYLILASSFGLAIGIFNTFVSEISFITEEVGYSEDEAGYLGFGAIICGIFGSLVAAIVLDRAENFKMFRQPPESSEGGRPAAAAAAKHRTSPHATVFKYAYAYAFVAMVAFAICTRRDIFPALLVWSCVFGFGAFAVLPTSLELAVEVTYDDAGEAIGTGGMWSAGQLCGLVMSVATDAIRNGVGKDNIGGHEVWIMPICAVVGVALAWSFQPQMKRVNAERSAVNVNDVSEGRASSTALECIG
ncbi:Major facilitator super domain-containing protein 7 [Geranomyces variabilis]|uniref:Major facilitator super domain-containing protein 7 n=1 Tax=Geranomyces variabilis TaxID=109894 RepID=A0AAD5TBU2_9FUNG|nr:Major facilitator super domain-containing protein 7 [Geranomyces variabilis]